MTETREIQGPSELTALLFHSLSAQALVPDCLNSNTAYSCVTAVSLYLSFLICKMKVLIVPT